MDCEKFEATLIDELYDELDEVTSAAAKRHVAGCARCASRMSGLRATRRLAVLELLSPPPDLEERILAAAREAQKVAPLKRRASSAISWAASWAMRPQTAMAALFLLMIGFTTLLLKQHAAPPTAAMTVSDKGEPVARTDNAAEERPAAAAVPPLAAAPRPATPAPAATAASSAYAALDGVSATSRSAGKLNLGSKASEASGGGAGGPLAMKDLSGQELAYQENSAPLGQPRRAARPAPPAAVAPPPAPAAPAGPLAKADGFSDSPAAGAAQATSPSPFDVAMGAYNSGDYATATRDFDQIASSGDLNAALWAARSVREGSGCQQAAGRFDQVARSGSGTTAGYDALFEAGHCYRILGQYDAARQRLAGLLTVPAYINKANAELSAMGASSKAGAANAQRAAPKAAAPQQQQQQAPPVKARPVGDAL
ncbi:MAG TPA: hypothetical protein VGI39_38960 [Polyangiaceae bacterium]|jgi:hypothetical protein